MPYLEQNLENIFLLNLLVFQIITNFARKHQYL